MSSEREYRGSGPGAGDAAPDERVAVWLKAERQRAGISQRDLAKRSGITQSVLGRLELAQSPIAARDERTIRAIADALEYDAVRALAIAGVWPSEFGARAAEVALLIERLSDRDRDLVVALAEGMARTAATRISAPRPGGGAGDG